MLLNKIDFFYIRPQNFKFENVLKGHANDYFRTEGKLY